MAIYTKDGKLLLKGGKLTSAQPCCCGCNPSTCPTGTECTPPCVCVDGQCVPVAGACCLPERCVYGASVALLVSRLNGGPAPEIAGWVLYGQSEPTFGTVGCTYNFYTQDAPCDLFTEPWQAALDDFNAKILAAAESIGYTQEELESLQNQLGSLTSTVEQASCQDGLSQSACESQGGTYHPGQTCAEGPCVDPCFENIDQYGTLYSSWLYPTCDEGKAWADTIFTCPDSEVFCDTPGYLCVQCDSCDFDPGRDLWSFGRWLLCIPPDLNNPLP